jgi:hypothetical protein
MEWLTEALEGFGLNKTEPEALLNGSKKTWVEVILANGSRLGGRLSYYVNRAKGVDICLSDLNKVAPDGQWRPAPSKAVKGDHCLFIRRKDYRSLRILPGKPEFQSA